MSIMRCPENSLHIIIGEVNMVLTAMKRSSYRWSSHLHQEHKQDKFLKIFSLLKEKLNNFNCELKELDPVLYLSPFLDLIRSETTSGIVTAYGLTAVYKFILYGLINIRSRNASMAAESIADSVTHARFMSVDASSDEIVLMKIIQVLRLLLLSSVGTLLTNESICEIIPSFFRICFETRFSEILRKTAESALVDSVQLLFSCLPLFIDDNRWEDIKKLNMHSEDIRERLSSAGEYSIVEETETNVEEDAELSQSTEIQKENNSCDGEEESSEDRLLEVLVLPVENHDQSNSFEAVASISQPPSVVKVLEPRDEDLAENTEENDLSVKADISKSLDCPNLDENNCQEAPSASHQPLKPDSMPLTPYGVPCVKELFGLLISLINPYDRHNSDKTIQIGLNLITVALETGSDKLGDFRSLLPIIKDELCHNLLNLLTNERLTVFASTLHIFFLLFEALRVHLKFQLEMFLTKLIEIIMSESADVSFAHREMSLDCLKQFWRISGFLTELFINYDCDLYCSNLFELLTKLLSENAFAMTDSYSIQLLSLDVLLAIISNIESHCRSRISAKNDMCLESFKIANTDTFFSEEMQNQCLEPASTDADSKNDSPFPSHGNPFYISSKRSYTSEGILSHEEVMTIKHKKKVLNSGSEQFNTQPSNGIAFLQEHQLLMKPLDQLEVATFLRNNPHLDKKMIGEYISNRKNLKVLEAFVKSFNFKDTRIDEALRQYLESFRLPGEAPLISLILEHFAEHWHTSNSQPFANNDAAFTLAYAIVMLNVDQHNRNVKKQSNPMTLVDFKKNLKSVNGGEDFDQDILEKIYTAIRKEEIIMPAEQTGVVRDNYLWKVLLRRGKSKEGKFIHAPDGIFDHDLFSLIWGPTVSALSFILDKSSDIKAIENIIMSFQKCATIAAYYGMADVFDNIIISLCKFTLLDNAPDLPIALGRNVIAQIAVKAVFKLVHCHGDILREGWRNFLHCVLCLFKAKLLPLELLEAEDFLSPNGLVSLIRDDTPSVTPTESGLFGSFYSYITSDPSSQRGTSQEEEMAKKVAKECIRGCHCDLLFAETKFLRLDSLQELIKTLIFLCPRPEPESPMSSRSDEDSAVFILELLIKIVLFNRDRISNIWPDIQNHVFSIVMSAAITNHAYILERAVVGILRISLRLVRNDDMIPQVMQALRVLLYLKPSALMLTSRQMAYALNELLKSNVTSISEGRHWSIVFSLMERIGAGAKPPHLVSPFLDSPIPSNIEYSSQMSSAQSDSELSTGGISHDSGFNSERGYTSDSELYESLKTNSLPRLPLQPVSHNIEKVLPSRSGSPSSQYDFPLQSELLAHDPLAFFKCCESLIFLIKKESHITKENFESCVHCLKAFVEASANGGILSNKKLIHSKANKEKKTQKKGGSLKWKNDKAKKSLTPQSENTSNDEYQVKFAQAYQQASIDLLDLLHTLHTEASSIFADDKCPLNKHADSVRKNLWSKCWCPLLQGIARLCYDSRREIRMSAFSLLQHALLVPELRVLHPTEWEDCFNKVLFPLLGKLLEDIDPYDKLGTEEARTRGASLLCKVFLQHLTPLLTLPTFIHLWSTILDYMDEYRKADVTGSLSEAIPESLKNMLLVMNTAEVFSQSDNGLSGSEIWQVTWHRIDSCLLFLKDELFPPSVSPAPVENATTNES